MCYVVDWRSCPPGVCDYLCSVVWTLRARPGSWLTSLRIYCPLKGEGHCQDHKGTQRPLLPSPPMHFLPMGSPISTQTSWLRHVGGCSVLSCLGFLVGPSGGTADLCSSQVPIPASHCSQKVFLDGPQVWLIHLVWWSTPGWCLSQSSGSLFSDVVGQHPGRREHCLFCGPLSSRGPLRSGTAQLSRRQHFLPQLAQAAGRYTMTSLNRLPQVSLAGTGAFDDLINPK